MADQIVVLDGARVVETGTHDDLMARAGRYAELYEIQAQARRLLRASASARRGHARRPMRLLEETP